MSQISPKEAEELKTETSHLLKCDKPPKPNVFK